MIDLEQLARETADKVADVPIMASAEQEYDIILSAIRTAVEQTRREDIESINSMFYTRNGNDDYNSGIHDAAKVLESLSPPPPEGEKGR